MSTLVKILLPMICLSTMSIRLRLAEIAGKVAKARQRDEIAHTVVQYFTLVCAKNTGFLLVNLVFGFVGQSP